MWRPWGKSSVRIHETSSPSSSFSCSSFKDVQSLCLDDSSQPSTAAAAATITTTACGRASIFHRVRVANSIIRNWSSRPPTQEFELPRPDVAVSNPSNKILAAEPELPPQLPGISVPGGEQRIVVYFTSLRVVRSTFEDCKVVRSILRGFRVKIDERDLSMNSGFLSELREILGQRRKLTLPRVFIGGRYVGGAEEVRQLHEAGELKKLVEGLAAADLGVCDVCGGYRFILCNDCDGSRKLYTEKAGFKVCTACNENGLIRCPPCSCAPL